MPTYYVTAAASGGGSGTEGSPYTLAEATANVIAGDKVWVKAGTYSVQDSASGGIMDLDVAGGANTPIVWEAYTTTTGDFSLGDAQPVILDASINTLTTCVEATTITGDYQNCFVGFRFTGATGDGIGGGTTANDLFFYGCKFDGNGDRGVQVNDGCQFVACEFTNNTTSAIDGDSRLQFYFCKIHGELGTPVLSTQSVMMVNCLMYNNPDGINVYMNAEPNYFIGNTFDGDNQANSVAINFSGTGNPQSIINNIFYDLGTAVNFATAGYEHVDTRLNNLFYSCTTNYDTLSLDPTEISGTGDPFTDSANRDYSLAAGSEARNAGFDGGIW